MADSGSGGAKKRENWQLILYASFVAQMLSITGFSVSIPFIPLFLIQDLHVSSVGEAGLWSGVMTAVSSVVMGVMAPIWGTLADRYGRKSMVLRAMFGGCFIIAIMSVTGNVWVLFALRVIQGGLTGTVPANIALVASVTPKDRAGYALGIMQTAVFTGASIGPLIGGTLADLTGYRMTFLITSFMLGLAGVIVLFFVHENFVPVTSDSNAEKISIFQNFKMMMSQKVFLATLLILSLVQFGNSVIAPVLALFIQVLNSTPDGAATLAGLELGITGIASAFSSAFAGRLSDRFGHRRVLFISALASAFLYFPQAFVGNVWELLILRGLMGLFFGGIIPSANALISQHIPEGRKGAAYGLVNGINSLGFAAGPIMGALIAAIISTRAVFVMTGVILLIAAFYIRRVLATPSQVAAEEGEESDHLAGAS